MLRQHSSPLRTLGHFRISRRVQHVASKTFPRWSRMTALCATAVVSLLVTSTAVLAQSSAQKTLDRFKSMVGTWQGKSPSGGTSEVTYQLAAGGTAVMADMHMADEDMVSMYYVDGDQLLMTHFCPSNNQPRMKAVISPDLNTVTFDFLDATNLPGPQTGHMHRAVFLFSSDPNHYSEEWTWKQEGKDHKMYFEMERKK
jgi:hypothetical protein